MVAVADKKHWTEEEYLAFDRASPEKHEFYRGEVFAMAGGTRGHNLLVANVIGELRAALRSTPCEVYASDMRVRVPATSLYAFPDVSVACGPEFEAGGPDMLLNPKVIIEVLSDSTEAYDRGDKFESYRTLLSLRDYVLVSQAKVHVEHYVRQPDGSWLLREARAGGTIHLEGVSCDLVVDEIYAKVPIPPPASIVPTPHG